MGAFVTVAPQTIVLLSKDGRYEEAIAASGLSPGHLIMKNSSLQFQKHNQMGGRGVKYFAIEDALQGNTILGSYNTGDVVRAWSAMPGDLIYTRIAAGAVAITKGDQLISDGGGCLAKLIAGSGGGAVFFSQKVASTAVTNTTTETTFDQNYTIPANFLQAGDIIKIRAQGIAPLTNSTDTLNAKLYIGATNIAATGALDVVNNDIFYFSAEIVVRTNGASGTIVASGMQGIGTPGTVTAKPFNLASTAIDTTQTQQLKVTGTWSVANAGDSCRLDMFDIEIVRTGGFSAVAIAEDTVDNSLGVAETFCRARIVA